MSSGGPKSLHQKFLFSQASQSTLEKLAKIKPVRDKRDQLYLKDKRRCYTYSNEQKALQSSNSKPKSKSRTNAVRKSQKTSRNQQTDYLVKMHYELFSSVDSRVSQSTGKDINPQHNFQRDKSHKNLTTSGNFKMQVVKNKKSSQQQQQFQLAQPNKLPNMTSDNISNITFNEDKSCCDVLNSQSLQSLGKIICQDMNQTKSTMSKGVENFNQTSISVGFKRGDSRDQYNKVKSKVKQNLRSKTPKGRGAMLTKQQLMDQNERIARRQQEIVNLENEVHKIQNDIKFKQSNKDLLSSTYQNGKQSQRSQETDNSQQDSTDESVQKVNLQSKKEFTDLEYMIQNHQFSDKYFDKVYLEICGFSDMRETKSKIIEMTKDQQNKIITQNSYKQNPACPITNQGTDVTGSITFFERRADKNKNTQDQNYETEMPQPADEFEAAVTSPSKKQISTIISQQSNMDDFIDSPTQIRRIEDFERDDLMSPGNAIQRSLDSFFKKRDEIRNQNQQLEQDFENIYSELLEHRKTASHYAFYEALNEYNYDKKQLDQAIYKDENGEKSIAHSPTKRLICMKNNQMEHLKQIKDRNLGKNQKSETIIYMASPQRSYVVKPEQKIDYNLAYKRNPSKFVEEALNQPITKHKIQQKNASLSPRERVAQIHSEKKSFGGSISSQSLHNLHSQQKKKRSKDHEVYTISTKTTSRPHNRINQKIKTKIEQKLHDKLGSALTEQVLKALEEANLGLNELLEVTGGQQEAQQKHKTMSVHSLPQYKGFIDENEEFFNIGANQNNNHETNSHKNPELKTFRGESNVVIIDDNTQSERVSTSQAGNPNEYATEGIDEKVQVQKVQ